MGDIFLPDSLEDTGEATFKGCISMKKARVPERVGSRDGVFEPEVEFE